MRITTWSDRDPRSATTGAFAEGTSTSPSTSSPPERTERGVLSRKERRRQDLHLCDHGGL